MSKYFIKNGRLTIKAAILLNALIVSVAMGLTVPITSVYFLGRITPQLVSGIVILGTITGILFNIASQSTVAIRWMIFRFGWIVFVIDSVFLILALFGEEHVIFRYVGYNLTLVAVKGMLHVAKKSNISNALQGDAIVAFSAKEQTVGMIGGLLGSALLVVLLQFIEVGVTAAMLIEMVVCAVAHQLQRYANNRISNEIRHIEPVTFIEAINDIFSRKKNKSNDKLEGDDILDQ